MACIEAPFRVDRRRAVAETHQKRMSDLIHKCGKTADVQLELPHDARLAIAACLWSGWPWHCARSGVAAGLRPEFVPSPHLATWWAVQEALTIVARSRKELLDRSSAVAIALSLDSQCLMLQHFRIALALQCPVHKLQHFCHR